MSVGEFNAVYPLILAFGKTHSDFDIFVSTTTATGQEQAKSKVGHLATVFYFPFDLAPAIASWLDFVRPDLVLIVETEIWPGFMSECAKRHLPVLLINGRLSPRSFQGYMRWRWFFRSVVDSFAGLAVQSEAELMRYAALLGSSAKIQVCGNIKIDGIKPIDSADQHQLRQALGLDASDVVLVAGSTHEGEEKALLDFIGTKDGAGVKLIVVPRHPERFARVAGLIASCGFRTRRFTCGESFEKAGDVYLLDTVGQLGRFYSLASLAFVGGTIVPVGGHNLAEPLAYACPVVCGPYVHKTRDIATGMQESGALVCSKSVADLHRALGQLCVSPAQRLKIGGAGKSWLGENEGALARTLHFIESHLYANRQQTVFSGGERSDRLQLPVGKLNSIAQRD